MREFGVTPFFVKTQGFNLEEISFEKATELKRKNQETDISFRETLNKMNNGIPTWVAK